MRNAGSDVGEFFQRMKREIEARDAAECEALGITADQLQARRDMARDVMARSSAEAAAREAREERMHRARDLPITDSDVRAIVSGELEETDALKAVREWLATAVPILILAGTVGRGKTVAACWAVLMHNGLYMRARAFERLFAHRYGEDEQARQDKFMRAGLVVVDDIGGREDSADGMASYLLDLVDERQHARTRTILITNQPRKALEEMYTDRRLHSRLAQSATWAGTRGDDLRGKP